MINYASKSFLATKIGFINQVSGRLFIDLIEDLSKIYSPSILYTGNTQGEIRDELKEYLFICLHDQSKSVRLPITNLISSCG